MNWTDDALSFRAHDLLDQGPLKDHTAPLPFWVSLEVLELFLVCLNCRAVTRYPNPHSPSRLRILRWGVVRSRFPPVAAEPSLALDSRRKSVPSPTDNA